MDKYTQTGLEVDIYWKKKVHDLKRRRGRSEEEINYIINHLLSQEKTITKEEFKIRLNVSRLITFINRVA